MKKIVSILLFFVSATLMAQPNLKFGSQDIYQGIKKLGVVGSVLYVAAHPDDENTLMLTWLANEKLVKATYLSINRGDGGQNLIGKEQSEQLGLIRTHELMAARNLDGADQFFTHATDFGFSKNTKETLEIWNEAEILGDVVFCIRSLQPDVIICRFPPDQRAGHGNHSASAVLAEKAFKISSDASQYPEQLTQVKPWQAKRIVWNSFNFAARTQAPIEKEFTTLELQSFNAILGQSYNETAAVSRSSHKSQGFGVPKDRGNRTEYFVHKDGVKATNNIFEDVDFTWNRLEGGAEIGESITKIIANYNIQKPENSLYALLEVYRKLKTLKNDFWREQKTTEVKKLIQQCAGLWMELNSDAQQVAQGDSVKFTFNFVNRSNTAISVKNISVPEIGFNQNYSDKVLKYGVVNSEEVKTIVASNKAITQPYWLDLPKKHMGQYQYNSNEYHGEPMAKASYMGKAQIDIAGELLDFDLSLLYKYTDEVKGEVYQPFEVKPKISVKPLDKVLVFNSNKAKTIQVQVKNFTKNTSGILKLQVPSGWKAVPAEQAFSFTKKNEEASFSFTITPTLTNTSISTDEEKIYAEATIKGEKFTKEAININYDHIPQLSLYRNAEIKVIKENILLTSKQIGYIVGAGDEVPQALEQLEANISYLTDKDLGGNLGKFQSIVVGIRAFNIFDDLVLKMPQLMKYVQNGGNLVVQYQVSSFLQNVKDNFGPYPFKLGRDRVTVEEAEMRFTNPKHAVFNYPNKITQDDLKGWVQERGLYFANDWDKRYETPLSSNDPTEKALDGGLLYAKYGKGKFIYTGYAFFRQLPAGVKGAYKLWANLVSK